MENKDIAIVGMSCFAPGATNITEFWNNLVNGVDSITDVPTDRIDSRYFEDTTPDVDRFYCKRGGFVPDITFDPVKYAMLPVAVEGMDSVHLLALKMVYQALEDAAVFEKKISLKKASLIIGKGNYVGSAIWRAMDIVHVGEQVAEIVKNAFPDLPAEDVLKIKKAYQAAKGRFQADSMPGLIPNLIASLIANKLDMQGPAYTIDAACASSLIALEHSVRELQCGRCDIAIAGGVHAGQNAPFWSIFSQLGALSHKQKITPFSEDADGLLIGEGGGFVVLKTLDKALSDNDRIYAVIKGVGVSSDGSGVSVMAPSVKGQKLAIEEAWKNADMDTRKVGYIEAHGTATVIGDKTELSSLSEVFPNIEGVNKVLLGSVKSNIGHAMPAAGILGLIKTTLSLYNRQIPPTLHCERPMKDIEKTRFRPVQKLEDWNESKYPLIAGVNAFGFGGINAHVILEAYGEKKQVSVKTQSPFKDKVIALCAPTKEALIDNLRKGVKPALNEMKGDYRLVLFDPTPERIEKAAKLISKDKPWKGRQDIWFTNEPLLKNGGKVAFLYPGFDPASDPEIESIIKHFGSDIPEHQVENHTLLNHVLKLYRGSEAMNVALQRLNLKSDMNAGHSLGEWFGAKASGLVSDTSVRELLESLDPEQFKIEGVYFIALGCGKERIDVALKTIPDLYLSNDNCPSQVLLCGTKEAIEKLLPILQKEQIYYQILSFQSGFHTPFIKHRLNPLEERFHLLDFKKPTTPIWSSTTLEIYPEDIPAFKELSIRHLTEGVRFRELIDKLYDKENARVFVQIGAGGLVGFVDDILKDKAYSAVSMTTHLRSTLEQIRRVLALIFIEGREVNLDFLGVNMENKEQKSTRKEMKLQMCMEIIKSFPLLSKHSDEYRTRSIDMNSLSMDTSHPVMKALNENLNEMVLMQTEIAKLFQSRGMFRTSVSKNTTHATTSIAPPKPITTEMSLFPTAVAEQKNAGKTFEEDLYISLDTHPAVIDHSLAKQPPHWECVEDLSPVIPMTMTFELLAEAAHKQDPSKKVTKIGPISVFQWMPIHTPFVQKIGGVWKSEELISLSIRNFANGEVTLRDSYSKPETFYDSEIDLGENIRPLPPKDSIYVKYMFHGPAYQGIEEVTHVTEKGIRAFIKRGEGKGSLLDNMGQLYGLYLQLVLDVNYITFPVKVQEITFYQDMYDQDGLFECICLSKTITEEFTTCEMILKKDGKVWCVIKGWQNRRFEFDDKLWQVTLYPGRNLLAEEIKPDIFYFNDIYEKSSTWSFLVRRYLNQPERTHMDSLPLNKRKDYLISRIAIKDALRSYLLKRDDKITYPIEFFFKYDSHHKPYVYGLKDVEGLEISIAHKGCHTVAIVSDKPVGIDIETIEERTEGFMELSFTEHELELLKDKDIAEWSTRFWVAKESYGKMLGLGLQGNPKRYEVKSINGEDIIIESCIVKTFKHKNFIIGWTQ